MKKPNLIPHTFAVVALLGAMFVLGGMDVQDQQQEQSHYCQMVSLWQAEARDGVTHENRAGWPDYQGNYDEVCK